MLRAMLRAMLSMLQYCNPFCNLIEFEMILFFKCELRNSATFCLGFLQVTQNLPAPNTWRNERLPQASPLKNGKRIGKHDKICDQTTCTKMSGDTPSISIKSRCKVLPDPHCLDAALSQDTACHSLPGQRTKEKNPTNPT